MEQLLDAQKQVVFQLLDRLGVQLTPAERTSLQERPTKDLQAFLLYSRGLAAEDAGDFGGAANLFNQPRNATRASAMPARTPPPASRCRAPPAPRRPDVGHWRAGRRHPGPCANSPTGSTFNRKSGSHRR